MQIIECLVMCFKYFLAGNLDNIFYALVLYLITLIASSIYLFFYAELLKITDKPLHVKVLGLIIILLNLTYLGILIETFISKDTFLNTGKINCKDPIFIAIALNGLMISIFLIILNLAISSKFKYLQSNPNYDKKKIRKLWIVTISVLVSHIILLTNEIYRYQDKSICQNQIGGVYSSIFIFFGLRISTEVSVIAAALYFFWISKSGKDDGYLAVERILSMRFDIN